MKLFFKKTTFYIFPFVIILFLFNFIVDPANLFSGAEKEIAKSIANGKNVTGSINIDERILQQSIIEYLDDSPEIIILGSSRIMFIGRNIYGDKARNNGVSGASIEDLIAIYQIYKQYELLPKKIVIGIDPWLFNENSGQFTWKSLKNYYYDFIGKDLPIFSNTPFFKYSQLFSLSYFQTSLYNLNKLFVENQFYETDNPVNDTFTRLADGTISYDLNFRNMTENDIKVKANNYLIGDLYSLSHYNQISKNINILFESLIKEITERNIEIEFFLAPYNPIVYEYIQKQDKYDIINQVENYIKLYAKNTNINIIGSYNPNLFNLQLMDFYDGMHLTQKGIFKIYGK